MPIRFALAILLIFPVTGGAGELAETRTLDAAFLLSDRDLVEPVSMGEFSVSTGSSDPVNEFSGSLRLSASPQTAHIDVIRDYFDRMAVSGDSIRQLPEFDFRFVQRGEDLVPLERGVQRREHPYWEIILQPGKVWNEPGDEAWTRAAIPFALQERNASCTHNGVFTWLFDAAGRVSRVAYQVSSETCPYFKFNLWGIVPAAFERRDLTAEAEAAIQRLDRHRQSRLPLRPVAQLADDYPGVEPQRFGVDEGVKPEDTTVLGMVVDGVHYRSDCGTRHGPHPYCNSLPLPSYSTAKSIFAGIALMRLEKLHPGFSMTPISALIDECASRKWRGVTIADALNMATGLYDSAVFNADEDASPQVQFIFSDSHEEKLDFACNHYKRKSKPGRKWVYHTSDTYLVGVAMANAIADDQDSDADLYDILLDPIWRNLDLSPLLDDTKRTYDDYAQPFTGYGLTFESDDIVRIARWLNEDGGRIDNEVVLDKDMLAAAMQRATNGRVLEAGSPDLRYRHGFWAFNASEILGCKKDAWVPFMSGFGGITVAMFPNGIIYYYFSDGYIHRWRSAIVASNQIRRLCS